MVGQRGKRCQAKWNLFGVIHVILILRRPAMDIVKEYAGSEFSPAVADDVTQTVRIFEANHARERVGGNAVGACPRLNRLTG